MSEPAADDVVPGRCVGRSALGECGAPPRFAIERPAGKGKSRWYACGRHLSWVVDFTTVPNRAVTVIKLPLSAGGSPRADR